MDIGIDQGLPHNQDLKKIDNGKYFFKLDNGKFDIDKFNRDFDQYIQKRKQDMQVAIDKRLAELNKAPPEIPAYNLSIGQLIINTKDALLNTLDDLLQFKFDYDTFSKNNRIFYFGLTFLILGLIFFMYFSFTGSKNESITEKSNVLELKHYIINNPPTVEKIQGC